MSPAALADFEAGKRVPYNRTLADICRALEDGRIKFIPKTAAAPVLDLKNACQGLRDRPDQRRSTRDLLAVGGSNIGRTSLA